MEETKTSIGKKAITYGLALAGIAILIELLFYSLDVDRESKIRWVAILIIIGAMVLGVKNYRDKELGGFITYGQSVKLSFLIGLYSAIVVSIFMYLFVKYFDPGLIEQIIESSEEQMLERNPNISDQEYEMAIEYTKRFTTAFWISIGTFFMLAIQAIIVALIVSIFMKKNNDSLDATIN